MVDLGFSRALAWVGRARSLLVALAGAKSIEDPSARHDAKECAQYMCPAYPNAAEKFIGQGCEGDFESFIVNDVVEFATESTAEESSPGVSTETLAVLSGACGMMALIVGFTSGMYGDRSLGYQPVPSA